MERALIEGNCKYIKRFTEMIPKQKHIVKKYEDDGNGACKKVTNSYIPNSWNFYLGNQVRRFIERNTH